eukprot:3455553-Pyramimonas_sp.AAC.3
MGKAMAKHRAEEISHYRALGKCVLPASDWSIVRIYPRRLRLIGPSMSVTGRLTRQVRARWLASGARWGRTPLAGASCDRISPRFLRMIGPS